MKTLIKFLLNLILRQFNLEIVSKDRQQINYSFDFDYQKYFGSFKNIIIFDVGANTGQSINRFRSIFINSTIHSFEPDLLAYEQMKLKYSKFKNIIFNNVALGDKKFSKEINIYSQSTDNSFKNKKNDTPIRKDLVNVVKLDDYIAENKIEKIHILKIDTQSYNKEILDGAKLSLDQGKFDLIEIEINLGEYYDYRNSFYEVEKYLSNYYLAGINKSGSTLNNEKFYLDVFYLKKKL